MPTVTWIPKTIPYAIEQQIVKSLWMAISHVRLLLSEQTKLFHGYLSVCTFILVEWKIKQDNDSFAISNSVTDGTNHLLHKQKGEPKAYLTAGCPTKYHGSQHTEDIYICQLEVNVSNQSQQLFMHIICTTK